MNSSSLENRYMEFRLGDQLYAIPLLIVKEVIQKPEITSIPNMPTHFEGMINLRGKILGVFSVRKRLMAKLRETPFTTSEVVVIIENAGASVGMIVDEVTRVLHPPPEMVRAAPLKAGDAAYEYVTSVIQVGDELVLTLHAERLLDLSKYHLDSKTA